MLMVKMNIKGLRDLCLVEEKLRLLENAGVDNWTEHGEALCGGYDEHSYWDYEDKLMAMNDDELIKELNAEPVEDIKEQLKETIEEHLEEGDYDSFVNNVCELAGMPRAF